MKILSILLTASFIISAPSFAQKHIIEVNLGTQTSDPDMLAAEAKMVRVSCTAFIGGFGNSFGLGGMYGPMSGVGPIPYDDAMKLAAQCMDEKLSSSMAPELQKLLKSSGCKADSKYATCVAFKLSDFEAKGRVAACEVDLQKAQYQDCPSMNEFKTAGLNPAVGLTSPGGVYSPYVNFGTCPDYISSWISFASKRSGDLVAYQSDAITGSCESFKTEADKFSCYQKHFKNSIYARDQHALECKDSACAKNYMTQERRRFLADGEEPTAAYRYCQISKAHLSNAALVGQIKSSHPSQAGGQAATAKVVDISSAYTIPGRKPAGVTVRANAPDSNQTVK